MRSVAETIQMGPMSGEINVSFDGERVIGGGQSPDQQTGALKDIRIDEPMVEGLTEMSALQILLPTMDLVVGMSFTVMVLTASEGTIQPVTISVAAIEEVTVPAGTFDAYRVEISSTEAPSHVFVSTEDHRVLKIVLVGQPVSFELVGQ